jgi:DNA-binding MarR family transcriptional regulator
MSTDPTGPDLTDPAACACLNLRKAARAVSQTYDEAMRDAGIRGTQFSLLAVLDGHGALPMTALAAALVMDRTTLTRNLAPLIKRGLVHAEAGSDRRQRLVAVTTDGRRTLEVARLGWRQAQGRLVGALGEARTRRLLGDLARVVEATLRA